MPRNPVDIHASSRISLIGHSAIVGCHQTADMLLVIALLACVAHAGAQINRVTPLIPQYGTLVGASIDFGAYNNDLSAYEAQLQRSPAAYVVFVAFPFVPAELEATKPILKQIGQRKAIAVITLEPYAGLDAAQSTAALNALAQQVLQWENFGVTVVVRFAHEMNGGSVRLLCATVLAQHYCQAVCCRTWGLLSIITYRMPACLWCFTSLGSNCLM